MSAKEMPNKDDCKLVSMMSNDPHISNNGSSVGRPEKMGKSVGLKNSSTKISWKGVEVVPTTAAPDSPTEELLGSVTSSGGEGAVRTSARVIKKMKLDLAPTSISEGSLSTLLKKDSIRDFDKPEDSTLSKPSLEKQATKLTKCRTPKALWSSTEKNLFFEALNEYGKDFDSITAYICNKMKRKSAPDSSTKAKHQVTTFYYRTWQKVSKYIKFDDSIKKVAQELYALINYGEMRKRMEGGISTSKLGVRLGELVRKGVVALRCRGRTLRVRTPVCRALRTLNQLHEWEEQLRLPVRVVVQLTARDSEAWRLVQGAAHNPRVLAPTPPSLRLCILLHLLSRRWNTPVTRDVVPDLHEKNSLDCFNNLECQLNALINPATQMPLKMEQTSISVYSCLSDNKDSKTSDVSIYSKGAEDVLEECGGGKSSNNNTTTCSNGNDLFTDDILYNKTGRRTESVADSQRSDEVNRSTKLDSNQQENVCTSGKLCLHVGPKPGLTFSLPTISIGEHLTSQRICLDSYQERLRNNSLFNGLQNGTGFKGGGRFKNQKRNRKDSGEIESIKGESKKIKTDSDNMNCDSNKQDLFDIDETANDGMDIVDFKIIDDYDKDKDFLSELEEDVECEGDKPRDPIDETKQNIKNKMCDKNKKESQKVLQQQLSDSPEDGKSGNSAVAQSSVPSNPQGALKNWNKDVLLQQIKKGWSTVDAGDLTIGDLYLMFGSDSKLEMEYWWSEASQPMQQRIKPLVPIDVPLTEPETPLATKMEFEKEVSDADKDPVDVLLMSPTHLSQDSNDTEKEMMSPDHGLSQQSDSLAVNGFPLVSKIINGQPNAIQSPPGSTDSRSPEQKESAPLIVPNRERTTGIGPRLKKLLSLAKLYDAKGTKTGCTCGHFCASSRLKFRNVQTLRDDQSMRTATEYPWQRGNLSGSQDNIQFRTPLPKATLRTNTPTNNTDLGLDKLPPWTKRGGRPRQLNVMPQRFTILPRPIIQSVTSVVKTSQISTNTSNTTMNSSATSLKILPKLKPKPCVVTVRPSLTLDKTSPASTNSSMNYAMDIKSEASSSADSIKTSISSANQTMDDSNRINMVVSTSKLLEGTESDLKWSEIVKQEMVDVTPNLANLLDISLPSNICDDNSIGISFKSHQSDAEEKHDAFTGLLPAESMSMSPSRLLKENDDQWLESEVHNFSLSSFLGHLEGPNGNSSAPSKLSKPDEETNTVDTPLHCLMNDSIDYVAKFEDLSKTS